jgi:hypothetical protein
MGNATLSFIDGGGDAAAPPCTPLNDDQLSRWVSSQATTSATTPWTKKKGDAAVRQGMTYSVKWSQGHVTIAIAAAVTLGQ